jgi:hypothetical protein
VIIYRAPAFTKGHCAWTIQPKSESIVFARNSASPSKARLLYNPEVALKKQRRPTCTFLNKEQQPPDTICLAMSNSTSTSTSSTTASSSPDQSPRSPSSSNHDKPEIPEIPYVVGRKFKLSRHTPPQPFGLNYTRDRGADAKEVERYSQLDWCLSHSVKPGQTDNDVTKDIHIIRDLRSGEASGAQILLVRDASCVGHAVAKIYDPMYYPRKEGDSWTPYRVYDVVARADADYAAEAAAYTETDGTPLSGTIVPRFYGTWTTNIYTHVNEIEHVREVRIILMEHVEGVRMEDLDVTELTDEKKDNVMVKLIEGESELFFAGIKHNDIAPRNVILECPACPSGLCSMDSIDLSSPDLRVCLIDFNLSTVRRLKQSSQPPKPPMRLSPVIRWWGQILEFRQLGWIPHSDEKGKWLWAHWKYSDGKYVDAEPDPDSPYYRPMPVGWRAAYEAEKAARAS